MREQNDIRMSERDYSVVTDTTGKVEQNMSGISEMCRMITRDLPPAHLSDSLICAPNSMRPNLISVGCTNDLPL